MLKVVDYYIITENLQKNLFIGVSMLTRWDAEVIMKAICAFLVFLEPFTEQHMYLSEMNLKGVE